MRRFHLPVMNPLRLIGIGGMFVLCLWTLNAQDKASILLPENPSVPVIVLDYQDGFVWSPRENPDPYLVIYSDGRVVASDAAFKAKVMEARIATDELQSLLHFIIDDQHFFEIDSAATRQQVRRLNSVVGIGEVSDGSTTVIRIQTRSQNHEARYYMLDFYARHYSDVTALAQLSQVERLLHRQYATTMAGSPENVARAAAQINDYVKTHPELPSVSPADLMSAEPRRADGSQSMYFVHEIGDKEARFNVMYTPGGLPSVQSFIVAGDPPTTSSEFLQRMTDFINNFPATVTTTR